MNHISIIGILNITPDSFSDGGLYNNGTAAAVARAQEMLAEGADIIDVGGESTRPGAQSVPVEEELQRVVPVISALRKQLGNHFHISVDTYKMRVADEALRNGATMVNSLGGFRLDEGLADVVREHRCACILYHINGTPQTMQQGPILYDDVVGEITMFFEQQIAIGMHHGIDKSQFIIDPGVGFGKTMQHNLEIIRRFSAFRALNLPLMIGVSRKGHLGTLLKEKLHLAETPSAHERVEAGLAETAIAITQGATYVRTHDVLQTVRFVRVLEELI